MCGIAGIWGEARGKDPRARLEAMLDAQAHRGPDGRGVVEYDGGAAGMVRLALVDLSVRGQQPMFSAKRDVAIVYNGEVYNFRDERRRLEAQGVAFQSGTDTEVVLALYLELGPAFVKQLRGMFALAIFDWRGSRAGGEPELLLARDPYGIKPLYISRPTSSSVVFASEIRSLLASGLVARACDVGSLEAFLIHGRPMEPRTMIEGVRMMAPGTLERFSPDGAHRVEQFYELPPYEPRSETQPEAAERLRAVLDESVRLHALADAPVGAFLSGGVDSTGIVGLMRPRVTNLHTFTMRFPDAVDSSGAALAPDTEGAADESAFATATARRLGCDHHVVEMSAEDACALLPKYTAALDQPSLDGFNTWLISAAAAEHVKGVLSGVGGDEWFAGYPVVHRMAKAANRFEGRVMSRVAEAAAPFVRYLPGPRLQRRADNLVSRRSPLTLWLQAHTMFSTRETDRLLGSKRGETYVDRFEREVASAYPTWSDESAVGKALILDSRYYMGTQLLRDSDVASMAHSLELRVPLVDREVVNFSRTCLDAFKLGSGRGHGRQYSSSGSKAVLIEALGAVLPDDMGSRPKRGFSLPFERWLQTTLAERVADTTSRESVRARGLLDPVAVETLVSVAKRQGTLFPTVWLLVIFELWCRAVLDAPTLAPSRGL